MEQDSPSFWRMVGDSVIAEGKAWLRWAGTGAIIGGIVIGVLGLMLFGVEGLAYALVAGVAIGGVGAWLLYLLISSY